MFSVGQIQQCADVKSVPMSAQVQRTAVGDTALSSLHPPAHQPPLPSRKDWGPSCRACDLCRQPPPPRSGPCWGDLGPWCLSQVGCEGPGSARCRQLGQMARLIAQSACCAGCGAVRLLPLSLLLRPPSSLRCRSLKTWLVLQIQSQP